MMMIEFREATFAWFLCSFMLLLFTWRGFGCRSMMRLEETVNRAQQLISRRRCLVYGLKDECHMIVRV